MEFITKLTQYKISSRDKKLMIIVVAMGILFCAYHFAYYPSLQETKSIQKEISQLKIREKELQLENDKADKVIKQNKEFQKEIEDMINHYGTGATTQKTIMFLEGLEQESGMEISVISFSKPETTITATQDAGSTNTAASDSGTTNATTQEAGTTNEGTDIATDSSAVQSTVDAISGYNSVVSIDFKVNYEGLKKSIKYINNYQERMNIKELNIVYDMETGNLNGTMLINMYQLTDTGKKEEEPAIAGVTIGKQNIFGTIEVTGEDIN